MVRLEKASLQHIRREKNIHATVLSKLASNRRKCQHDTTVHQTLSSPSVAGEEGMNMDKKEFD